MRILIVSSAWFPVPPPFFGGLEVVVADLCRGLAARGHDVTLVAPAGSNVDGCRVICPTQPLLVRQVDIRLGERLMWDGALRVLAGEEFDVINGHNWIGYEYSRHGCVSGEKICHTHHGHLLPSTPLVHLRHKRNAIFVSQWLSTAASLYGVVGKVAHNGVDASRYTLHESKGDRLLYVGRFEPYKNALHAIKVARDLGMPIDLVGGSFLADYTYLAEVMAKHNGRDVNVMVDVSNEKKIQLMREARCLLFPTTMGEPFGLVAVESMLCGTPVIAYNDGAVPEIAAKGSGMRVCDCTPESMRDAYLESIDSFRSRDVRRHGEEFTSEKMALRYEELYKLLLDGAEW